MYDYNQKQETRLRSSCFVLWVFFVSPVSATLSSQEAKFGESHLEAWWQLHVLPRHLQWSTQQSKGKVQKVHANFLPTISGVYELTQNVILWIDGKKTCYFFHEQLTFVNNKAPDHQVANLSINSPWQERQPDCMQAFMTAFLNVGFGL